MTEHDLETTLAEYQSLLSGAHEDRELVRRLLAWLPKAADQAASDIAEHIEAMADLVLAIRGIQRLGTHEIPEDLAEAYRIVQEVACHYTLHGLALASALAIISAYGPGKRDKGMESVVVLALKDRLKECGIVGRDADRLIDDVFIKAGVERPDDRTVALYKARQCKAKQ